MSRQPDDWRFSDSSGNKCYYLRQQEHCGMKACLLQLLSVIDLCIDYALTLYSGWGKEAMHYEPKYKKFGIFYSRWVEFECLAVSSEVVFGSQVGINRSLLMAI